MKKIFLTDTTLHTSEHRPTASLEKAVKNSKEAPRLYSPKLTPNDISINPDGTFRFNISLPQDVLDGVAKGEIEIVMPKAGYPIYAGKDTIEKVRQMEKQETNEIIHREKIAEKKRSIM